MQFRFVKYEDNKNKLISYVNDKDFSQNNSPDEIFKLLWEIKKAQEQDYDIWVETNDKGRADEEPNGAYEIKSISLVIPDSHQPKDDQVLPHISVEIEEK